MVDLGEYKKRLNNALIDVLMFAVAQSDGKN